MTVAQLIKLLESEDPAALVVYWPDVHESSGYSKADVIERVWVKAADDVEMDYSRGPKDGFVPAVHIA